MKINLHYIAGFFDGEGSCGMYPCRAGTGTIRASITQRKPEILCEIQAFLLERYGIKSLLRITSKGTSLSNRPCHVLEIYGKHTVPFLKTIYPYLRIKRTLAQDIVRYRIIYPPISRQLRGRLSAEARWGYKLQPA